MATARAFSLLKCLLVLHLMISFMYLCYNHAAKCMVW